MHDQLIYDWQNKCQIYKKHALHTNKTTDTSNNNNICIPVNNKKCDENGLNGMTT